MQKTPENPPDEQQPEVPSGYEAVVPTDQNTQCPSLEETKRKKEIWLIKVPEDFDASYLTGRTVVLNGVQDMPNNNSTVNNGRFEILSKPISSSVPSSFKALIPSSNQKSLWTAKAFKGSMSVVKSISVPSPDTRLQPEPHGNIEAPEIKTRWKPFGYKQPFKTQKVVRKEDEIEKEKDSPKFRMNKVQDEYGEEESFKEKSNEFLNLKVEVKVEKTSPQKFQEIRESKSKDQNLSHATDEVKVKIESNGETPKKKRKKGK